MSQQPIGDPAFRQSVATLIAAIADVTRLTETTEQRAHAPRLFGSLRRRLASAVPGKTDAVNEIQQFGAQLTSLHRRVRNSPTRQAQLQRDVDHIARYLTEISTNALEQLDQAASMGKDGDGRASLAVSQFLRIETAKALGGIAPPQAAPESPASVPATPGSILPPAARAFAAGTADLRWVAGNIDLRSRAWWKHALRTQGVEASVPSLRKEVGNNPLTVARAVAHLVKGVPVGTTVDALTREPQGTAVIDPTHSTVALGASGIGKTTGVIAPYTAYRAAAGDNVVVVTPQSGTIELILPTAKALSGQGSVPIIDFGGEIVSADSAEYRTWDVTRRALTTEGAMAFAEAFAGPKTPAREQLSNSEYWGGLVADLYAAGAHVAAGMREVYGLDPNGLNGMARVYDFLKAPTEKDLPTELAPEIRAALKHSPAQLRRQEKLLRDARAHAEKFHPRLKKIAFHAFLVESEGVALSDEVVGDKLVSLSEVLTHVGKSKQGDPMESLLTSFKRAVPPHERLVMSPRPGQPEIQPEDLVKPGAGVSFVAYAHTGSTGAAAGAFMSAVLDAAIEQNKSASMLRAMGGADGAARLSFVLDEGNAGRHVQNAGVVVTDGRQLGVTALVSMTSEDHLRDVFGERDAGKLLNAPCVIDLSPGADKAARLAPLFGAHVVERLSDTSGSTGGSTTKAQHKEDILTASDLTNLPRGTAVMVYASAADGKRVLLVRLPQFEDREGVLGAAVDHVRQHPEKFEPIGDVLRRYRPDLASVADLQRQPLAFVAQGTEEAVNEALADPAQGPAAAGPARQEQPVAPEAKPAPAPAQAAPAPAETKPAPAPAKAKAAAPAEGQAAPAKGRPAPAPAPAKAKAAPAPAPAQAKPAPAPAKAEAAPAPAQAKPAPAPAQAKPAPAPAQAKPAPAPAQAKPAPAPAQAKPAPAPAKAEPAPAPAQAKPAPAPAKAEPAPAAAQAKPRVAKFVAPTPAEPKPATAAPQPESTQQSAPKPVERSPESERTPEPLTRPGTPWAEPPARLVQDPPPPPPPASEDDLSPERWW